MRSHNCVTTLKNIGSGLYELVMKSGETFRVFICECYSFGIAEYMEAVEHLRELDVVIINSSWCGYTLAVKRHCRDHKIGLFTVGDFMSALHRDNFWNYLNESEVDKFKKRGWE